MNTGSKTKNPVNSNPLHSVHTPAVVNTNLVTHVLPLNIGTHKNSIKIYVSFISLISCKKIIISLEINKPYDC